MRIRRMYIDESREGLVPKEGVEPPFGRRMFQISLTGRELTQIGKATWDKGGAARLVHLEIVHALESIVEAKDYKAEVEED